MTDEMGALAGRTGVCRPRGRLRPSLTTSPGTGSGRLGVAAKRGKPASGSCMPLPAAAEPTPQRAVQAGHYPCSLQPAHCGNFCDAASGLALTHLALLAIEGKAARGVI
jgi:hypothetical protein